MSSGNTKIKFSKKFIKLSFITKIWKVKFGVIPIVRIGFSSFYSQNFSVKLFNCSNTNLNMAVVV